MANKQDTKPFEITVPLVLYEHLTALAAQSHLGATESAVAVALIVAQIDEREKSGLSKMLLARVPTPKITEPPPTRGGRQGPSRT